MLLAESQNISDFGFFSLDAEERGATVRNGQKDHFSETRRRQDESGNRSRGWPGPMRRAERWHQATSNEGEAHGCADINAAQDVQALIAEGQKLCSE
jgi:hypothetical protein